MLGKILGIILLILLGLFTICSCKVASWAEQEMEKFKEDKENEN